MNHLRLELSPVLPAALALIEAQARDALKNYYAARKLVDFDGPHGWGYSSVDLGAPHPALASPVLGAETRLRATLPLLEVRVPFEMALDPLDGVERGVVDLDFEPVVEAARKLSLIEDRAVFYGVPSAQILGIASSATQAPVPLTQDFQQFPSLLSEAITRLHGAGVGGPYALVLDTEAYGALSRAARDGYPVLQHVRKLIEGPTVWSHALAGALVLSMRGGDFQLVLGQDAAIGYASHTKDAVQLYLEESFTFRIIGPEAAVALRPAD